jgi:hypothetical protein
MRMLSRTTAAVGAVGLVAAGLASAVPANAARANATQANATGDIFKFQVTEVQTSYDDDFAGMPDVGDSFEWTSNLRQDGDRVGKDAGSCEFKRFIGGTDNDPDEVVLRCEIRYQFFKTGTLKARGQIRVDWDDFTDSDFDVKLPIREGVGTGKFDNAGGTVRNRQVSESKAKLTFRLTHVPN